jgi:hypothetical protein
LVSAVPCSYSGIRARSQLVIWISSAPCSTTTAQGSVAAALNTSGTTTAAQFYAPYGASRYSSGTMPTDEGYTGQRADAATGLDDS